MGRSHFLTLRMQISIATAYIVFVCCVEAGNNATMEYTDTCFEDRNGIFPCSSTVTGNLVLIAFYGTILGFSGALITDGAEMLLYLGVYPTIVGGVILPLLGCIPDCAIIVVSGLGEKSKAQEKLSVGMGTLAGSTIMLLTIAWAGSLLTGRCELDYKGESIDGTGKGRFGCTDQGITLLPSFRRSLVMMLITSSSYLVIQSADWYFGAENMTLPQPTYLSNSALATMVLCCVMICAFLGFEIILSRKSKCRLQNTDRENNLSEVLQHASVVVDEVFCASCRRISETSENHTQVHSLSKASVPESSGPIGGEHISGSYPGIEDHSVLMNGTRVDCRIEHDSSESRTLIENEEEIQIRNEQSSEDQSRKGRTKRKAALKSSALLLIGGVLASSLASPMCDAIDALTNEKNKPHYLPISSFYVSFIVTPLCSNASELVSSLIFASRRKRENITITYTQIFGACTINNTVCLGIFTALVYFRGLQWYYSAEVLAILVVQLAVGLISFQKTYKVYLALPVGFIYFLSLALIYVLENFLGWR